MREDKKFILSPSALNLFIKDPALWVMKHYFKVNAENNIYFIRGRFVENCCNMSVRNNALVKLQDFKENCLQERFKELDDLEITDKDLEDYYYWGKYCYENLPKDVVNLQTRAAMKLEGIEIAGYIDYEYKDKIIDLKTTNTLPIVVSRGERAGMLSTTKSDNIRQQVIYKLATGKEVALLYVSPENTLLYNITEKDVEEIMPSIKEGIKNIKKLLTLKIEDVILTTRPEKMTSFYWTDNLRKKAKEIWKL